MPPPKPQQQPSLRPRDYSLALLGWLLFPALCGAAFTRRRFGLRMVGSPGRYLLGTLAFAVFHDIGGMEAHWHNPPFLQGWAWRYFELMYAVAAWHTFEAWRAFRRREQRHTYSMGQPWLMLLGIPYRIACLLDAALIFGAGDLLERVDVALGAWLMWGAGGLVLLLVLGTQQQFTDTANLMDAGHYAGNIQDRVEPPEARPAPNTASSSDDEVLSTGARQ